MNENETWKNDSTGTDVAFETQPVSPGSTATPASSETTAPAEDRVYTSQQVQLITAITQGSLHHKLKRGYIAARHVRNGGRWTWLIKESELRKFLAKPANRVLYKNVDWSRVK
jgi:hypothetical protein